MNDYSTYIEPKNAQNQVNAATRSQHCTPALCLFFSPGAVSFFLTAFLTTPI